MNKFLELNGPISALALSLSHPIWRIECRILRPEEMLEDGHYQEHADEYRRSYEPKRYGIHRRRRSPWPFTLSVFRTVYAPRTRFVHFLLVACELSAFFKKLDQRLNRKGRIYQETGLLQMLLLPLFFFLFLSRTWRVTDEMKQN